MKKGSVGLAVLGWLLFNICSHAQEAPPAPAAAQVRTTALDAFVKQDSFNDVKLSPTGEFYAVSVPLEDRTVLVILRRSDLKQTGMFSMRGKTHVANFWWVNRDTVVIALGEKSGGLEQPVITGELASTRADGTDQRKLVTMDRGDAIDPRWSPDGSRIAFVHIPDALIYVVNADGGGVKRVSR